MPVSKPIRWRLHCKAPPEQLFELLATDAGRERFWAKASRSYAGGFLLSFPDGTEERCEVLENVAPRRFQFSYFGSIVTIELEADGRGGTDLTLVNTDVPDEEFDEVNAGWVSVLLPLKAAADFRVDLRNHDPKRTWREGYVDQ
jgi:uncharacterized protein YndB with AHSA1/START domain